MSKFLSWMKQHDITFTDNQEFMNRFEIFVSNEDIIEAHNAAGLPYKLGHNQFSHLTEEEFIHQAGLDRGLPDFVASRGNGANPIHTGGATVPSSVDWVAAGAVTGVKDQGSCGSCWSFSTTGCMEGAYYLKNKNLLSFSEQQLVSCDTTDLGCNGGLMDSAFGWIQKNGGICTEQDYPYTSGSGDSGTCYTTCQVVQGTTPVSWTDVAQTDDALVSAIAQQPVSVAIQANQLAFRFYSSGVLTGRCGTNLDHGVLAVGYGTDSGLDYFKVKNSWGTSWGEEGYVRIERGTSQTGDECGILLSASYVTL